MMNISQKILHSKKKKNNYPAEEDRLGYCICLTDYLLRTTADISELQKG